MRRTSIERFTRALNDEIDGGATVDGDERVTVDNGIEIDFVMTATLSYAVTVETTDGERRRFVDGSTADAARRVGAFIRAKTYTPTR